MNIYRLPVRSALRLSALTILVFCLHVPSEHCLAQETGFADVVSLTQPKVVKITGSGGFRGLEAYQSGFLISDDGYILTVWSYVLDRGEVSVTLDDGQRFTGRLTGYDPRSEIAVLKIDATGLPFFNMDAPVQGRAGTTILAFSNLFGVATGDEKVSVMQGHIAARTTLDARSGARESAYRGDVYIIDAITNNPGAAGGVVTDRHGELIGLIGKELKDSRSNMWMNFCIPVSTIAGTVLDIRSGKILLAAESTDTAPAEPMTAQLIGFQLVPDVVRRTPPFVDLVTPGSVAETAGIRPDDLVVEINGEITPSCRSVVAALGSVDRDSRVEMTVQRGTEFIQIELELVR